MSNVKGYKNKSVEINPKTGKKKKSRTKMIVIILSAVILSLIIAIIFLALHYFGGLNTVSIDQGDSNLGISSEAIKPDTSITNIALFGVDSRSAQNTGLSDAIIILTIDKEHNKLKMTSVLRDSLVPVDGYGEVKINAAYSYGGATLALKTLNQNFSLAIRDYVTINYNNMAGAIDSVGGLELEITEAEMWGLNETMAVENLGPGISEFGTVTLNGTQATAYARMRKLDSDEARASRQQMVISAFLDKCLNDVSTLEYPGLIRELLMIVETSMGYDDIFDLVPFLTGGDLELETLTIPSEAENATTATLPVVGWVWQYDLDVATNTIHDFIYEENEESSSLISSSSSMVTP